MPIEDIALDMKKNSKNTAYCDKLSKTMRSIQEKLNHNKSSPKPQDPLSATTEDGNGSNDDNDDDDDDDDDYYYCSGYGYGGYGGDDDDGGDNNTDADLDPEVEVLVPIKGPMSKRISMVVTTPRSTIKSRAFAAPPLSPGSTYVERSTDVADYGEFPEVKFLRPAGMDPEKTREFLMSIKDMIMEEEEEEEEEEEGKDKEDKK